MNATMRETNRRSELEVPQDPSSPLHIHLDPALRAITPAHWAYDILNAIRAGDVRLVSSQLTCPFRGFFIDLLTEPLGPMRQTLLHVAALLNQGAILCELLKASDQFLHVSTEEQRLDVRKCCLSGKGSESDPHKYQTDLGAKLDKVERVSSLFTTPIP